MDQPSYSLKSLIESGLIGAALGASLSKDKSNGALLGFLIGAAFSATLQANEKAKQQDLPILEAINGSLYKIFPNGEREFIKDLPKAMKQWDQEFQLK